MKQITTILLAGSAAILMTACGGSSSSGDTDGTEITYDLRTYIDKTSLVIDMNGTNPYGLEDQYEYSRTYIGTEDYQGTTLDVHSVIIDLGWTGGIPFSIEAGTYLGNMYSYESPSAGICYITPGSVPTPVPTNATIGYESDIVTLECAGGNAVTVESSFKLVAGEGDTAIIVSSLIEYNPVLNSFSYPTYSTVDPDMNLLLFQDGNFTSTSIEQY